jgi:5-formyltetrahydrofolate cyclo-ligase
MMNEKRIIRRKIAELLKNMQDQEYTQLSNMIAHRLFQQQEWLSAKIIGITVSIPPEVDTRSIIMRAWKEGKKVAVPKCEPLSRSMEFKMITDFTELESVYSGLLEPVSSTHPILPAKLDLLIVPGLAFTAEGYRLGFGGGYYDRFLVEYNKAVMSLAFAQQIVEELPVEKHDRKVPVIITPNQVYNNSK